MSTRSGRVRASVADLSPPRTRKGVSPPRSPARTRKLSPASKTTQARPSSPTSRSSQKSPSRKSPSRKPVSKYPARKSPSRTPKDAPKSALQKSPGKRPTIKSTVSVKLEDFADKMEIFRGTRSKRIEYSIRDVTSTTDNDNDLIVLDKVNGIDNDVYGLRNRKSVEEVAPRRSSRLREFIDSVPDIRSSLSKSLSKSVSQSIDTFSDEENSADEYFKEKSKPVRKLATPLRSNESQNRTGKSEFGGAVGSVLLMLLIPTIVFATLISCKKSCSLKAIIEANVIKSLSTWVSIPALTFVLGQAVLQVIFAITPVCGKKLDRLDDSGVKFCFNGFFASILTLSTVFLLDFYNIIDKEYLVNNYVPNAALSFVFAVLLSVALYVKSKNYDKIELNVYGQTGIGIYDFFVGREIHPFIKNLDIKIWISRISNINALILTVLIFRQGFYVALSELGELSIDNLKLLPSKAQWKPTILLFTTMQLTYILNFITKEHKVTTTFYWQSEGVGYLQTVSSALYPFYFTAISKYVADNDLVLSTNILITASIIYVLGFLIMLVSNNIKYEFRRNPSQLSIANLDSMPTFHGKKLLVSNLWGVLRHPNYAGDILIHIALALPGIISKQYLAAAPALTTIVILMHRAWRDHVRCNRRYGAAWNRYCKRVPSVLIPKVL